MSIFKMVYLGHLAFVGSNNGFFEKPNYINSYRSSIDTIAVNCLVFQKIAFLHFGVKIQDGNISAILDFRGPVMGSLKSPCTTSCRSSIDTIAPNCLLFEKIAFFAFRRQTDEQMDSIDALSRSRCRERRLNPSQQSFG